MPVDRLVGANLRALRNARGVSVDQLGSVLGISGNQVTSYETGAVRIPPAHIIEICKFFQVRLEDLFPRPNPDQNPQSH